MPRTRYVTISGSNIAFGYPENELCENLNADMVDYFHASQTPQVNTIVVSDSNGFINNWINQGSGSGLDADKWDGGHKTISSSNPSGGSNGDVWFKV